MRLTRKESVVWAGMLQLDRAKECIQKRAGGDVDVDDD
jgi:hypothetical protein